MDLASIGFKADTSGIDKANKGLDDLSKQGGKTDRALGGASSSIGKAFAGIAVAVGSLASATSALQKLVSVSREFDVLNAGLITATGSAQNASKAFKAIQDFATTTPYSLAQATKGFTQLVNLGLTPSEKALTSYGNTAAAMGKDLSQMIEAVADAATGEFERLKEFGIKAKSEGDNVSFTFRGMTTTVKKSADEIEGYLMSLGQNEFAGAMTNRMNTLDGAISNLSDSWDAMFLTISQQGAGGLIESSVRAATDAITELTDMIASGQMGASLDAFIGKFKGWGADIAAMLGIVSGMFSDTAKMIQQDMLGVGETVSDVFFNMPENIRAALQIATVEVASWVDKIRAYMNALSDDPFALTVDMAPAFARIDEARASTISKIMDEREAALKSFDDRSAAALGLRKKYDDLNASIDTGVDRLAKYKVATDKAAKSSGEFAKKVKDLDGEMDEYTESAIWVSENESRMFESENVAEMEDELTKLNGKVKEYASISEKAAERIEQAFADAWLNAFDGFESVVDGMKNAFKRMLAEMAHMALTRPIMVSMGLGGMLPSAAGAATGAATGGAMAGLGLLGGIGGGFVGAGGMIGGAFGSGLMGGGALLGAGQFGTMFSGAGSLLGSGNIMAGLGMAMPLILGAGAALAGIQKLSGGGLFGTSYSTTGQSLGLSLSGGDVSGSITTEESRKRSLFRGTKRRTTTTGYDASAIDDAFDAITGALSESAKMFGITGADEIIKGFSAAANIDIKGKSQEEVQAAIQEWVGNTTAGLVSAVFGDSLDGLQKEGEGVIDTVNRLSMNMTAVQSITKTLGLGFDLTGKAAMVASTNIVELAGGIDQLSALTSQYYASFYSEAEQQQNLATQLAAEFEKLNITMPMTREGFRSLVDGLDLTTESGQAAFAALMQLVPGMDQYLTALEAQRTASEQAAEAAQKEAEAKAAALKAQGLDLQLRLYEALGQSSEALAMRRQMELESTDETLRALLMQIYAAEDAAAAQRELAAAQEAAARLMQQRQSLEIQLLEATGQSAQATALRRQLELESMDESLRGLQQSIWTAQDAAAAQEALAQAQAEAAEAAKDLAQNAFGKLQEAAEREKGRIQTELDSKLDALQTERDAIEEQQKAVIAGYQEQGQAVQDYISRLEGLNGVINNFLADTGSAVDPFKRLGQIFSEVKAGLLPDQAELSSVLSGIQSAGSASFGSATDQQRAMAIARNQAAGIGSSVSGALSGAVSQQRMMQAQIDSANAYYASQLARLDTAAESAQKYHDEQVALIDKQLADAEKQLNALLNIDDRILSMTDALAEFYAAMSGTGAPQVVAATTVSEAVATAAVEQVEAIERVEAAIIDIAAELIEFNKPDDRVWVPPTMPDRYTTDGVPMSTEMIDLLNKILSAQESTAKHTAKTADTLQRVEMDGLDTRTAA